MRRLAIIETNYKHDSKGLEPYSVTETWQVVNASALEHPFTSEIELAPPRWRNVVITSYFASLTEAEAYAEAMEHIMAGQGNVATVTHEAPR